MRTTETIRDFTGIILGTIETDSNTGNKIARNFNGQIVGFYDKSTNVTRTFLQQIVSVGDSLSGLLAKKGKN